MQELSLEVEKMRPVQVGMGELVDGMGALRLTFTFRGERGCLEEVFPSP
jgi:hypothetical protein